MVREGAGEGPSGTGEGSVREIHIQFCVLIVKVNT